MKATCLVVSTRGLNRRTFSVMKNLQPPTKRQHCLSLSGWRQTISLKRNVEKPNWTFSNVPKFLRQSYFGRLDKLQLFLNHTCSMFTEDKEMRSVHIVKHGDGSVSEIKRSWRRSEARQAACVIVTHLWLRGHGSSNRLMTQNRLLKSPGIQWKHWAVLKSFDVSSHMNFEAHPLRTGAV